MRKQLLLLAIIFTFSIHGQAQNSIKKEKIKALFALMHQDTLMVKTMDAMTSSMVKNMTSMFSEEDLSKSGIDVSKMMEKLMAKNMKKSKEVALKLLNVDMVDIYDKYFTLEEIEDFNNFYKSKSGQKLLSQMPDITKDLMTILTTKYQVDFQQSIMKDVEELTNEMMKQTKDKK